MRTAALLAALYLALPIGSEAKEPKEAKESRAHLLTRSIYLPVEIRLCGHLRDAVLYQDGQAVSLLPARRIVQFTYYPALSRVEPLKSDLRVEGRRSDGSDFVRNLAVTPWGVFASGQRFELDMETAAREDEVPPRHPVLHRERESAVYRLLRQGGCSGRHRISRWSSDRALGNQ